MIQWLSDSLTRCLKGMFLQFIQKMHGILLFMLPEVVSTTEHHCIFLSGIWLGRLIIAVEILSFSFADKGMSALVNTASAFPRPSVWSCSA